MAKSINLFLSGAQNFEVPQGDINASIGGYPSNTPIPKNLLNGLFSEISIYDFKNPTTDTLAIFLKNTGSEEIESLQFRQTYDEIFGQPDSICKFEFAFVEPNEKGFIEILGSKKEIPLYADFLEPIFRRETGVMKLITAGETGDELLILGQEITLTGNSMDSLLNDIVKAFRNNSTYTAEKMSDSQIFFKKLNDEFDEEVLEIITPGSASSDITNIGGGINETIELLDEPLLPNEYIGIWIRRSLREDSDNCVDIQTATKKENLEILFDF